MRNDFLGLCYPIPVSLNFSDVCCVLPSGDIEMIPFLGICCDVKLLTHRVGEGGRLGM